MVDSIIDHTDSSIRRRFTIFYKPADVLLFLRYRATEKHSAKRNDTVTKKKTKQKKTKSQKIKRNEGTRESKTFTRRGLLAKSGDWDRAPKAEFCDARE